MRIGVISDHLATTTGFRTATKPFVDGFLKKGWDVHYLAVDSEGLEWDDERIKFTTTKHTELILDDVIGTWIEATSPDIIFGVRDPGSLVNWSVGPKAITGTWASIKDGYINAPLFKTVFYIPIEGMPISRIFGEAFLACVHTGGKPVFYTPAAMKLVEAKFPDLTGKCEFVYHGLDHFPENNYSDEDRLLLKEMAGMEDRLVVMSVGTNKRTKGIIEAIYTAAAYKKMYGSDSVIFYLHTDAMHPIIGGYDLIGLRHQYDVEDIVVFKQYKSSGPDDRSIPTGVKVDGTKSLIEKLRHIKSIDFSPEEPEEALANLRLYKFADLFAMSDLYLDLSQIEGWGLPVGEAMRWGLPVLGVSDHAVRDEVYGASRIIIEPEDVETWTTYNSGARLLNISPSKVATMIRSVVNDRRPLDQAIAAGKECSSRYTWDESVAKMIGIIEECYGRG